MDLIGFDDMFYLFFKTTYKQEKKNGTRLCGFGYIKKARSRGPFNLASALGPILSFLFLKGMNFFLIKKKDNTSPTF
jgi:hypothetical protein